MFLGQTFSNINLWAGADSGREDCYTCNQGGRTDKKEYCFRRNILYESVGEACEAKGAEENLRRITLKKQMFMWENHLDASTK